MKRFKNDQKIKDTMKIKMRFYPLILAPLILMLGFIWVMGGTLNIYDVNFSCGSDCGNAKYSELIGIIWAKGGSFDIPINSTLYLPNQIGPNPIPGMAWLLENVMAPNAGPVMTTMAVFEILIGLSILLGAFTRISLFVAPFMNLAILLASGHTHPGILRINLLMLAAAISLFIYRREKSYGLDPWLSKKLKNVPVLRKIVA